MASNNYSLRQYHLEIQLGELNEELGESIWLVNPFEIGQAEVPEVLEMWNKAKDYMAAKPGFINARLFRADTIQARYGLLNVSQWQNADLFMEALNSKNYDTHREQSKNYNMHPSLCTRVDYISSAR